MKRLLLLTTLCGLLFSLGVGAVASQDGQGLVRLPAADGGLLHDYLFPRFYRLDPATGELEGAAPGNLAMVIAPQASAEIEQTLRLRDDLRWRDGRPVTAWDALGGLLLLNPGAPIDALTVIDDHTLALRYTESNCANTARVNPFLTATTPAFEQAARAFIAGQPPGPISLEDWLIALESAAPFPPQIAQPDLTVGLVLPEGAANAGFSGFSQGALAVRLVNLPAGLTREQAFLQGETNVLFWPSPKYAADLLTQDDVQVARGPGWGVEYLVFNFANPETPRSAFTQRGQLLDQGHNPFFADKRVRQAVALALDVETMIDVGYFGEARRFAGTLPPNSWGYNHGLTPPPYDPAAAARLLDEAGWVDTDGDGIRNCYRCQFAEPGTELVVRFANSTNNITGDLMTLQLARIGISLSTDSVIDLSQRFDLMLVTRYDAAHDPDQWGQFARAADVIGAWGNIGSYFNPTVEALLEEARTLPSCPVTDRAALYQQAQALLAEDLPMLGLYNPNYLYLARGIDGFDPRPGDPFWNLPNWRVTQ
jgi:ABC-type transport system substrate-binding protein